MAGVGLDKLQRMKTDKALCNAVLCVCSMIHGRVLFNKKYCTLPLQGALFCIAANLHMHGC